MKKLKVFAVLFIVMANLAQAQEPQYIFWSGNDIDGAVAGSKQKKSTESQKVYEDRLLDIAAREKIENDRRDTVVKKGYTHVVTPYVATFLDSDGLKPIYLLDATTDANQDYSLRKVMYSDDYSKTRNSIVKHISSDSSNFVGLIEDIETPAFFRQTYKADNKADNGHISVDISSINQPAKNGFNSFIDFQNNEKKNMVDGGITMDQIEFNYPKLSFDQKSFDSTLAIGDSKQNYKIAQTFTPKHSNLSKIILKLKRSGDTATISFPKGKIKYYITEVDDVTGKPTGPILKPLNGEAIFYRVISPKILKYYEVAADFGTDVFELYINPTIQFSPDKQYAINLEFLGNEYNSKTYYDIAYKAGDNTYADGKLYKKSSEGNWNRITGDLYFEMFYSDAPVISSLINNDSYSILGYDSSYDKSAQTFVVSDDSFVKSIKLKIKKQTNSCDADILVSLQEVDSNNEPNGVELVSSTITAVNIGLDYTDVNIPLGYKLSSQKKYAIVLDYDGTYSDKDFYLVAGESNNPYKGGEYNKGDNANSWTPYTDTADMDFSLNYDSYSLLGHSSSYDKSAQTFEVYNNSFVKSIKLKIRKRAVSCTATILVSLQEVNSNNEPSGDVLVSSTITADNIGLDYTDINIPLNIDLSSQKKYAIVLDYEEEIDVETGKNEYESKNIGVGANEDFNYYQIAGNSNNPYKGGEYHKGNNVNYWTSYSISDVDFSLDINYDSYSILGYDSNYDKGAQTFTVEDNTNIKSIDLEIRKRNNCVDCYGDILISLLDIGDKNSLNDPNGTRLAWSRVKASEISSVYGTITVPLDAVLESDKKYAIVLDYEEKIEEYQNRSNYEDKDKPCYLIAAKTNNSYKNGKSWKGNSKDDSSKWIKSYEYSDLNFNINVTRFKLNQLHEEWVDFQTSFVESVVKEYRAILNSVNVTDTLDLKLYVYSGYQDEIYSGESCQERYSVDWEKLAEPIDYAVCGYGKKSVTKTNDVLDDKAKLIGGGQIQSVIDDRLNKCPAGVSYWNYWWFEIPTIQIVTIEERRTGIVQNKSNSNFMIYPNPTSSRLFIETNVKEQQINSVSLFDVFGKQVIGVDQIGLTKTSIDLQPLTQGGYILKVNNDITIKIVKD